MQGVYNFNNELEWQVQVGSNLLPEYWRRSLCQSYYELKKALGIASSAYHSISITLAQYQNDHFIVGVDTERIVEAGFTGLNRRNGLMTTRCKNASSIVAPAASATFFPASKIYDMAHAGSTLEIRETGSQVFDWSP